MVIVSAKLSKRKILAAIVAALCVIALLVILCHKAEQPGLQEPEAPAQTLEARDNDARRAYLASFGWQVSQEPAQTQEVRIPAEFNEVFTRYNELQQSQGFDLSAYAGKAAKRYVYPILNHPDGEGYAATVLVCRGRIIGGDVTGSGQGSQISGFAMPQ